MLLYVTANCSIRRAYFQQMDTKTLPYFSFFIFANDSDFVIGR